MYVNNKDFKINIPSEIGVLRSLIIHSPDGGLGKIVPDKAQDWLFEDIVHLDTIRKGEYDYYIKLLLYFLDIDTIKGQLNEINNDDSRSFFKPNDINFHNSGRVIEFQNLLSDILRDSNISQKLVAAVGATEGLSYQMQCVLLATEAGELARILISGTLKNQEMIFAPIPNLIFTRDIGIVINQHILINKAAKKARSRETLLAKYIFYNHPYFTNYKQNIIEIPDNMHYFLQTNHDTEEPCSIECGDLMMVSKNHLLIGLSERTSALATKKTIEILFAKKVVEKISVIKIPNKRAYMHLDTVFTQVKKNMWVILHAIGKYYPINTSPFLAFEQQKKYDVPEITQYFADINQPTKKFESVEALLCDVSENDLGSSQKTEFIYSGNQQFPHDLREQWTDSCNVLALKEGVVIGYDRNEHTIKAFENKGFTIINVKNLLHKFETGTLNPETLENTFITMPSAELSRARGGFHCMSLPLYRSDF
ncbi:MAG: amidinotransferase [Sphingobacteriales bacterium]|nr:MAG: amidinotransferase [Sphingobacteriales bacterium]TAF78786.1 MAG: amidinotransferase [Sphingobacteriales bacterium]